MRISRCNVLVLYQLRVLLEVGRTSRLYGSYTHPQVRVQGLSTTYNLEASDSDVEGSMFVRMVAVAKNWFHLQDLCMRTMRLVHQLAVAAHALQGCS